MLTDCVGQELRQAAVGPVGLGLIRKAHWQARRRDLSEACSLTHLGLMWALS